MDDDRPQQHWFDRIPPLLLVLLGLALIGGQMIDDTAREAEFALAGVLIGAAVVLEAIRHR